MTIEITPQRFLQHPEELSITDEELVADLTWPYSADAAPAPAEPAKPERTRTITWEDPLAGVAMRRTMSGREYLEAMQRGELPPPPMAQLMDIDIVEVGDGRATFEGRPGEQHYNPIGVVHGGFVATLLDSVMGCAVETLQSADTGYTSLDLKVNYVRPVTMDTGRVLAEGVVVHAGRRVATAEGRVFSARTGKLLAHGSATLLILGDQA
jgi:uncharacterized protein (TIGR00369 family)